MVVITAAVPNPYAGTIGVSHRSTIVRLCVCVCSSAALPSWQRSLSFVQPAQTPHPGGNQQLIKGQTNWNLLQAQNVPRSIALESSIALNGQISKLKTGSNLWKQTKEQL